MDPVTELPDYIAAIIAQLRAQPAIIELCASARISGELANLPPNDWGIYIGKAGGDGSDPYIPHMYVILETRCFGPNKYRAMQLFRRMKPALEPISRENCGFVRAGCAVLDLRLTGGPTELVDPTDDSPFVLARWRARISEVPQL